MAIPVFQSGAILVEDGTILPRGMSLERSPSSHNWRSVLNLDRLGLEAQIAKAGWTFFYMAGAVKKLAFGFDADSRARKAVARVIKDVEWQKCNCLELTRVAAKSFLGIAYTSVTAQARHIQDGCRFRGR
jgi:hypothetical protein